MKVEFDESSWFTKHALEAISSYEIQSVSQNCYVNATCDYE